MTTIVPRPSLWPLPTASVSSQWVRVNHDKEYRLGHGLPEPRELGHQPQLRTGTQNYTQSFSMDINASIPT